MIRRLVTALLLVPLLAIPAAAHKLRVFATVEGGAVVGYAFFVGGGRAKGTSWTARTATGSEIASGTTDGDGRFRILPPQPVTADIVITVDTREGHIASATVAAARWGGAAPSPAAAPAAAPAPDAGPSPPLANEAVAALVEAAVQRQVEPLLERIEAMDSRLRLTDAVAGVLVIFGVAGIVLWARGRPR